MSRRVPKLRFKEFSGEWEERELGDITKVYDGTHQTPSYTDNGIPFYSVENVTSNNFENTKYISKEVFEKEIKRVKLEKEDILLTRIGDIGTSKYIDWKVKASFYVSLAVIKHSTNFNSKYLKYFFDSSFFQKELNKRTLHIAFPKKINLGEISKCKVFLPKDQNEQQKIANTLSSLDKFIEAGEKKVEALKKHKKGLMQQLFPQEGEKTPKLRFEEFSGEWEESLLGNYCEITTGKLDANAMVENGKYRFYTCAKEYYLIDKYQFDTEALLISGNGANVGYIHYYNGKFNAYQRTYVLDQFQIKVHFLKYFLQKNLHQRILIEKKDGNTPYIVMSTLTEMPILLPTLPEQEKIADTLSFLDNLIEAGEKKVEALKKYKKGLMQQMFVSEE